MTSCPVSRPKHQGKPQLANRYIARVQHARRGDSLGMGERLRQAQNMTRPQTSSMCSKPVRDVVAALPMASKASIHSAWRVRSPWACHHSTASMPMASKVASWLRWRKLAFASPRAATCSQGLKASAAPKYWMSPMTLLTKAATAHARATSKACRRGPHNSSKPMQAQLTSKGTVLGCGEGDQGASQGNTSRTPSASSGAHAGVLTGRRPVVFKPMCQPPRKTPCVQQGVGVCERRSGRFA